MYRLRDGIGWAILGAHKPENTMNAAQVKIIANIVTESALDMLASKHNTTAQVIADLVRCGHENMNKQFLKLVQLGLQEAIVHVAA